MPTDGAHLVAADAGSFEPFDDFKVNLRQLALYLVEMHGGPCGRAPWPFSGEGPISKAEKGALADLALEHLLCHDLSAKPIGPRCTHSDRCCRALGGAQTVFTLLPVSADEEKAKSVLPVRRSLAKAVKALDDFGKDFAVYLRDRIAIHQEKGICTGRAHIAFCTYPWALAQEAAYLWALLPLLDRVSLLPQVPEHLRGGPRRGLLVLIEMTLARHGWSLDEILAVIHDGVTPNGKDTLRARKTRLRERLRYSLPKVTAEIPGS
jgi:hypothetical protein